MTVNSRALFLVASVAVSVVCSAAMPYERYQSIVDRKPFGPEPVNFDPEAAPGSAAANAADPESGEMTEEQRTAEEQQMAASVRVSMINVTPAGAVAVGFTDSSAQPAENYYLIVGRSQNGWTVKSADPAAESVTLEKGGVEVTVKLGESSGGGAKGANARQANRLMSMRSKSGKVSGASQEDVALAPASPRLGGMARLRQRRAELRAKAQAAEEKKAQAAAAEAAEREERAAREAEEQQARAEREARDAEERAQQREALRQIQEQLRRDRETKEAAQQLSEDVQEE